MHLSFQRKIIAGVLGLGLVVSAFWLMLPSEYEASTLILVDPAKIPERFVLTSVTMDYSSRLSTINQQLMSSTRLQRIIDTYDLYKEMKGHQTQEEIIERMRENISVEVVPTVSGGKDQMRGFRITYRGSKPGVVMQITNQLASLFIEENLKVREAQAEGTSEFIDTRLDMARKALLQQMQSLRAAKSPDDREMAMIDYNLIKEQYSSLVRKKLDADIAADLEKRQKSERFTILDPARIPEKPVRRLPFFRKTSW